MKYPTLVILVSSFRCEMQHCFSIRVMPIEHNCPNSLYTSNHLLTTIISLFYQHSYYQLIYLLLFSSLTFISAWLQSPVLFFSNATNSCCLQAVADSLLQLTGGRRWGQTTQRPSQSRSRHEPGVIVWRQVFHGSHS